MRSMPARLSMPAVNDYESVKTLYRGYSDLYESVLDLRGLVRDLVTKLRRDSSTFSITNRTEQFTLDCDSTSAENNADVLATLIVALGVGSE